MKEQSATPKFGAGRRIKSGHGAAATEVPTITNATPAHSDQMRQRMVKYAVTMGIRMVCIGAIFLFDGWYKLIPVIGAVLLPWVAVVIANGAADVNHQETVDLLDAAPLYEVAGGSEAMDHAEGQQSDFLTGEIVPDDEDESAGKTAPNQAEQEHHEHL